MLGFVILLLTQLTYVLVANDNNLWITQFIEKYGYPVETHHVETSDGYILTLFRIPHGLSNKTSREVALLVHGMGGSAENFLFLGPPDALAFYLADRGYDVWLFNARGTAHSRKHRSLNPSIDRKKFWDFSWNEIGLIDLPTSINYILTQTSKKKIFYAGHSQGTTIVIIMLAEFPEMNEKFKAIGLLAASVRIDLTTNPALKLVIKFVPLIRRLLEMLNWYELSMPNSPMTNVILKSLCRGEIMFDICVEIVYAIGGTSSGYFNKTLLLDILETAPSGFSVRQPWHYAQVILTGELKKFDYGKRKNLKLYNSTKPPLYNLSNVQAPIGIFYAADDYFANEKMSRELLPVLPNIVLFYKVQREGFNHLDYVIGNNAREAVYDPLYKLFQDYEDII